MVYRAFTRTEHLRAWKQTAVQAMPERKEERRKFREALLRGLESALCGGPAARRVALRTPSSRGASPRAITFQKLFLQHCSAVGQLALLRNGKTGLLKSVSWMEGKSLRNKPHPWNDKGCATHPYNAPPALSQACPWSSDSNPVYSAEGADDVIESARAVFTSSLVAVNYRITRQQ